MYFLKLDTTKELIMEHFDENQIDGTGYATQDQKNVFYDWEPYAVKFTTMGEQTVSFQGSSAQTINLEYSYNGKDWTEWQSSINNNKKVLDAITFDSYLYVRGKNASGLLGDYSGNGFIFSDSSTTVDISGNIMSLIDYENESLLTLPTRAFEYIFHETPVRKANNLLLPATSLTNSCYNRMFKDCTCLVVAPALPAMTLADLCYKGMFEGCVELTKAPELPATALTEGCYANMFKHCTRLTKAPELPATTLAIECYMEMFAGCVELTKAPELPATTLADNCYDEMFYGCTNLKTAPELPATALTGGCYLSMFGFCTSLTTAPSLPATTVAEYCYYGMFSGCTNLKAAPELPATTMEDGCYTSMFENCNNITTAPALPATTLAVECYTQMFKGCTRLKAPVALPATALTVSCYESMFEDCTSLNVPSYSTIPFADQELALAEYCCKSMFKGCINLKNYICIDYSGLAPHCFESMFENCTSLTFGSLHPQPTIGKSVFGSAGDEVPWIGGVLQNACFKRMFAGCRSLIVSPYLPSETLVADCYKEMFSGCTNLQEVGAEFLTAPGDTYTKDWLSGVYASGVFYAHSEAGWVSSYTPGPSTVPVGWFIGDVNR